MAQQSSVPAQTSSWFASTARGLPLKTVGIFNAKGTVTGELLYVLKKLTGNGKCALCDITHGWNPFGKRSWKEACAQSPIEVTLLHIEEASQTQLDAAGSLPAFIVEKDSKWGILMSAQEIETWANNPIGLLNALEAALHPLQQD